MRPIFLCGFMGCGKSTVGKILAKRMGCECIDLDKYIEDEAGMSIPEIFEKQGEAHFRQLETEALAAFADIGGVVATGGGALLSEENCEVAKRSGMVVFIDTYFATCYDRIKDDPNRPIAYNSTKEQLLERYNYRRPLYEAHSHYTISGGYPPLVIAAKIQKLYKRLGK
ncbi:shikimate kinase [Ruminococcus sp.]|uniref:shikimate kinase n=1 Tax=Ruminococcus sp. TaxID=41978 RepID=UPI0025F23BCA|nr:shikimate kinase [Ruminococcus sp.]